MKIKANETVNKQEQDLISGRHINSLLKDKHNIKFEKISYTLELI